MYPQLERLFPPGALSFMLHIKCGYFRSTKNKSIRSSVEEKRILESLLTAHTHTHTHFITAFLLFSAADDDDDDRKSLKMVRLSTKWHALLELLSG